MSHEIEPDNIIEFPTRQIEQIGGMCMDLGAMTLPEM